MPDESDSLDLSQLSFRPQWVDSLETKGSPTAGGEVIWGRADGRAWSDDSGGFRDRGDPFDRRGSGRPGGRPGGPGGGRGGPGGRPGGPGGARGGPAVGGGFRRPEGAGRPDNRGPRPGGPGGPGGAGGRPDRGPRPPQGERRGPGGPGGQRDDRRGPPRGDRPQRGERRDRFERDDRPQFVMPLGGWEARLLPDPRALDMMSRQIRGSGRAYPIFEVARLFLGGRERFLVKLAPRAHGARPPEPRPGQRPQPEGKGPAMLHRCRADGSLWVTREEALNHILFSPALESYYRKEDVTVEPPKGNFTAIAVCGFSGALLGPPSHHSYQLNVARLHRERFADMPLERFKSRIFVEKEEATVAKWLEQCSKESHWVMVDPGEDGNVERFKTGPEMEAHFMRTYAPTAVEEVSQATVPGTLQARYMSPAIASLVRMEVEQQQRFPMQLVQDLCRDLERSGLRFFKRDRKSTFVCRSRPHYLPEDLVLSDRIKAIVEVIRANPGIDYTRLVGVLAPHLRTAEVEKPAAPAAEAAPAAPAAPQEAPLGAFTLWTQPFLASAAPAPETKEAEAPKAHLAPEELAILQDLRWLMGEGYVTEFNTGELQILGRATQQPGPRRRGVQEYEAEETNAASIAAEALAAEAEGEAAVAAHAGDDASKAEAVPAEAPAAEDSSPAAEAAQESSAYPSGAFTLWTLGV